MFKLNGKLEFININQDYLEKLHNICSEVYYKRIGYENKPYIGILINNNGKEYIIPLSSAKDKHKNWKNIGKGCYLIYEIAKKSKMGADDIWSELSGGNVKHILSVIDVKKMIPIIDGVYNKVDININGSDDIDIKKYKNLLNKEYIFCLSIIDDVIRKANKVYDKQLETGKVSKFCCDFKLLEEACAKYKAEIAIQEVAATSEHLNLENDQLGQHTRLNIERK